MKHWVFRLPVVIGAAATLCSCVAQPRNVAFDEAAFARYKGGGTGTVTGQAFTVLRDSSVRVASNTDIGLMPDTAYTEEIAARLFDHGTKLQHSDPRFKNYQTYVTSDMTGNFKFSHVHPGNYYVFCDLPFEYSTGDGEADDDQWIYEQVTVKNGETVQVKDWTQGH